MNTIVNASEDDRKEILSLYESMYYGPAGWSEDYPCDENIDFDLSRNALFVMKNDEGEIIAAITIDDDENVANLPCWSKSLAPGAELSRLGVRKDMQNQGIAKQMMKHTFEVLRKQGYKSVHILVNVDNEIALRSYAPLGYKKVGDCHLYDHDYVCMEIEL